MKNELLNALVISLAKDGITGSELYRRMMSAINTDAKYSALGGVCEDEIFEGIPACVKAKSIIELQFTSPGASKPRHLYFECGTIFVNA